MKTKHCRCCNGSGEELDHKAVGAEMRSLREKAGLSLEALGRRMRPRCKKSYLCDLEHGLRNWTLERVEKYRKACL